MASELELCNMALGRIGALFINGLDDGTINANHCARFYPAVRDGAFRLHHWNFAAARANLAQIFDPPAPLFEFQYAYQVPSDFIKLREYYDNQVHVVIPETDFNYGLWMSKFRIEIVGEFPSEQKAVLSNGTEVKVVYTRRIQNPDLWDPMFFNAVSLLLSADLANAITKDFGRSDALKAQGMSEMFMAMSIDGQEQSVEPFRVPDLLWGRQ